MSTKLVNEGETLSFGVTARDPEGSTVRLYGGKLPPSAKFKDNGDGTGTFSWTIPYLGPGSASGSPFVAIFVATDGAIAVQMDVPIEVINVNRPPQISTSGPVTAFSGDSVFIPLMASDPDLESITFSATNLPTGAQIHSGNPGYIIWGSSLADSGNYGLDIVALDESGGITHKQVALQLLATLPIELSLSNEQAFPNEVVTIPIILHNRVDVAGFHLLVEYDPSLLTPQSFMRDSIRTKSWYPFAAQGLVTVGCSSTVTLTQPFRAATRCLRVMVRLHICVLSLVPIPILPGSSRAWSSKFSTHSAILKISSIYRMGLYCPVRK